MKCKYIDKHFILKLKNQGFDIEKKIYLSTFKQKNEPFGSLFCHSELDSESIIYS